MLSKKSKIYIAGHSGMVGSAIVRLLQSQGYTNLVLRTRNQLDLLNNAAVTKFFQREKPSYVILAAAKVGGIQANINNPATFLYENLVIQHNIIHNAYLSGVNKVVFLASSCIYPRECLQPMKEEYIMTGKLEPTNEGYALAKIVGIKMIESYHKQYGISGMSLLPCNLYGTNDSFHPEHAHVLSSLVRKFVDAVDDQVQEITMWGTGIARREFMHVDDCAKALLFLLENYTESSPINVGCGSDVSIKELAEMIANETGFIGTMKWDASKPDGMPRKCLDISKITNLGFEPSMVLRVGVRQTISEYRTLKSKNKL